MSQRKGNFTAIFKAKDGFQKVEVMMLPPRPDYRMAQYDPLRGMCGVGECPTCGCKVSPEDLMRVSVLRVRERIFRWSKVIHPGVEVDYAYNRYWEDKVGQAPTLSFAGCGPGAVVEYEEI